MLKVRHRARMRTKDVAKLDERFHDLFGVPFLTQAKAVDRGTSDVGEVVIADGEVWAFDHEGALFPTVRALLKVRPTKRFVTVDMGAVRFVMNGADIMSPGITSADALIAPGDPVWVRDERNQQPLAVGEALLTGDEMARSDKGKAVKSLHRVGDDLWNTTL